MADKRAGGKLTRVPQDTFPVSWPKQFGITISAVSVEKDTKNSLTL